MSKYNKIEMEKNTIDKLLESVDSFHNTISSLEIFNMNYDNPPESTISSTSREWILFFDECIDFTKRNKGLLYTDSLESILNGAKNNLNEYKITSIEKELCKVKMELESKKIEETQIYGLKENNDKKLKIFISHATVDLPYIKCFVELLEAVGLTEDNMFCSSIREYGVRMGKDIFETLKTLFKENKLMVMYMLSDNYYRSAVCLNEMGAAWILQSEDYSILLPGFDFSKMKGTINPNKVGVKLDGKDLKADLNELKEILCKEFKIIISSNKWERVRDSFINKISKELEKNKKVVTSGLLKKSGPITGIEHILADEIEMNLKKIVSVKNYYNGAKFDFLDILNTIDESKFSNDFYQLLPVSLDVLKYDLYEKELVLNGKQESLEIVDLYTQFKLWNTKGDLHNFSAHEYLKFRRILLKEFNKFIIEKS